MACFSYMCTLLGCFKDVPQSNTGGGNSHNGDDELKCINAMDIHLNLLGGINTQGARLDYP